MAQSMKEMTQNSEPSEKLLLGRQMTKEFLGEEHLKTIQANMVSRMPESSSARRPLPILAASALVYWLWYCSAD